MKQKAIIILSVLGIALLCNFYLKSNVRDNKISINTTDKTISKAEEIKSFLKKYPKYNPNVIFLLDMRIPSYKNRFFCI